MAAQFDPATTLFITAGKRAAQFIARTHRQLAAEFTFADSPQFAEARPIAAFARDLFLKREVDQVQIVATRFINTMTQEADVLEFLPIGEIKGLRVPDLEPETDLARGTTEVLFEPSPGAVLSYLFGHYLNIFVYRVLLEAKASEQSARMVAMTSASDNAGGLIKDLTLEYNKLRQDSITKELLEIAGGQLGN
jgi:F-type H+-transporting ATPase subunit gamma